MSFQGSGIQLTHGEVKNLNDKNLHNNLLHLKSKESEVVALIVSHLNEVYRRRLYSDFRCASIYDYCIKVLGYSNGEAHRKISACKLICQIPSVRESLATGELSLSNAASVQTLVSKIQKKQKSSTSLGQDRRSSSLKENTIQKIIEKAKNKSTRECEKELFQLAKEFQITDELPQPMRKNLNDLTQLKICVQREDLDRLKRELGIACEQELVQSLMKEKLAQLESQRAKKLNAEIKPRKPKVNSQSHTNWDFESSLNSQQEWGIKPSKPRSISPSKRAIVMKKTQGKCEVCGSYQKLEIDHKLSVAKGGGNEIENLRLLCRSCNQRAAIKQLGIKKMQPYLFG